ncbi:MAG: serine/threonine protein kinase [Planctomycetes bacterium]|nr:serine/threonine protein kinase [Planctomycetota bacterium]
MAALPIELFGHRVIAKIGTGAASEVFVVQDIKSKQVWAMKRVVYVDDKSARFIEQVEQEYAIGSKLDHPNIRGINKLLRTKKLFKTTEVGLLMELVDAETMDQRMPRSIGEAANLFAQVARGLEHMNERGFVHGDMKPINVMVTEDRKVKIIDLGQACKIDEVKKRIQGTPGYIAPEQAHREAITPQTDVYNFGATIYWVMAGEVIPTALPPQGDNVPVSAVNTSMIKLPVPLKKRNPNIPEELSDLVQECVQLDPSDRAQGMGPIAERLELIAAALGDTHTGLASVGGK